MEKKPMEVPVKLEACEFFKGGDEEFGVSGMQRSSLKLILGPPFLLSVSKSSFVSSLIVNRNLGGPHKL
ncbi:hypothetical protein Hanom_Chr08g00757331 [Helianthus anomalus]